MTRFIDVPTMSKLVYDIGVPRFIGELADTIRDDFLHWPEFDKFARVANHSDIGVIVSTLPNFPKIAYLS